MSKNKIFWSVALFLTAVLALPIAYAQAFTGTRIYFVLVNAVIIGLVLFILQAFLVPGKGDKERVSMWLIVIIIALMISWFYGSTSYIWQGPLGMFFSYYVLVNSIVIGVVLYFIFGLLKVNEKLGSKEGQVGYGILIFIISLMFAVKLGNQWIWSQPTISSLISYLFGEYGILTANQNRIFIFIGTSVLFAVFFDYIGLGKENRKLNYMLAIIFAANLVSGPDPYQYKDIKPLLLIIGTWILGGNLSTQFTGNPKWKIAGYVIAFLLMMWAVSSVETAVTPEGKAAVAANGGGITGWIWGWTTTLLSSKGLWILGAIILFLFFVIFRGENRRRIWALGVGGLFKRLNTILRFTNLLRSNPKGREPQIFRENRLLIQACANYTTRSEITYRYLRGVEEGLNYGREFAPKIGKWYDAKRLRHDLIAYRSGDGTKETLEGEKPIGWNRMNLEIVDLINRYFELIMRIYISATLKLKGPRGTAKFKGEAAELKALEARSTEIIREINTLMEHYKVRIESFRYHHVLNGYKLIALNMFNVTGEWYENPLKFAKPEAEFQGNEEARNEKPAVTGYFGPSLVAGGKMEGKMKVPIHQVNQFGEFVEDIIKQKDPITGDIDPIKYKKPRKLKNPEDIIDHPDFVNLMTWLTHDWNGLAEDVRYGLHHPKSRTFTAYEHAIKKKLYPEYADESIHSTGVPTKQDQAVDMRALADPGLNKYWGRKWYYAQTVPPGPDTVPPENPLPNLSSLGIKHYLQTRIELDMRDKEEAHRYMMKIPADTGVPRKEYRGKEVIAKVGGTLAQKTASQQTT